MSCGRGLVVAARLGATLLVAGVGCRSGVPRAADSEVLEIEVLLETAYSELDERERRVLRSPAEWQSYWRRLDPAEPGSSAPAVNFDTSSVVVAAMGRRPTGGYSVAVREVGRSAAGLEVTVEEIAPGPGCITTQAFTAPAVAVKIPRVDGPVRFREVTQTRSCD